MISFIIPAHDEAEYIGATVQAVQVAMREVREPFEVIVVDDASIDATAEIARGLEAQVVSVSHRKISATRNSGAKVAQGEILFFIDADTLANARAIRASLAVLRSGAVGGGCVFRFDGGLPLWARVLYPVAVATARTIRLVGGAFLFCTRDSFDATGGFDERYFAAEEVQFIKALKKIGRFRIPGPTVITSARKLRTHKLRDILRVLVRWVRGGEQLCQSREGLEIWYGKRESETQRCDSPS